MTSLKMANRRVGSLFAVAALVLATVTPGLIPAFASAAQLSERTIQLGSASKEATDVDYLIGFTPVANAKAVVVDFCSNSPLVGADCTAPVGFTVAAAATDDGFTRTTGGSNDANTAIYTGTVTATTPVALTVSNVTNPDEAGALYVRIVTYDGEDVTAAETAAKAYTSTVLGDNADEGSAAASITDTIGVSGAVLETMTFCVAGVLIAAENCVGADALADPVVKLGEASTNALSSTAISEGSIFSQISTNALSGAVVNLKSSTTSCGGLVRPGATNCDITPALAAGITAGQAKFGVTVASATDPGTGSNSNGTFRAAGDTPYYSDSVFKLNFVAGNGTGITSPYGDTFLDTDDAPVNNKNVEITFGASVANNTPAGLYSADLSLIATGKF